MRFLRENLFLVIVVAVVLLGGGALVAGYLRLSKDTDSAAGDRVQLAGNFSQLAGGGGANAAMVESAEKRAEVVKSAVAKVEQVSVDWNRANFPVFQLPEEGGKTVPAFPIDEALYRDQALDYTFTRVYLEEMNKLLASLKPTISPTDRDIESRTIQYDTRLQLQQQAEAERTRTAGGSQRTFSTAAPTGETAAPSGSPYATVGGGASVSEEARQKGLQLAMIDRAKAGVIYANLASLDMYFTEEARNRPYSDLWQAQLNYWVNSDIIGAINQANQEVLGKLPPEDRNVLNAPVKHLVRIDVAENYVQAAPEQQAAPAAPRPAGRSTERFSDVADIAEPAGGQPAAGAGAEGKPAASPLTNRGSNKDYDALHYSLTVVMPPRFLPLLERNLLARNYHTILSIQIEAVGETGPSALSGSGAAASYAPGSATGAESNSFYYGPDTVVQLKIDGELLLLTAWERGTWDEPNKRFLPNYPPLIPTEALQQQFAGTDNPAMRPEDVARLPQQAPAGGTETGSAPPLPGEE